MSDEEMTTEVEVGKVEEETLGLNNEQRRRLLIYLNYTEAETAGYNVFTLSDLDHWIMTGKTPPGRQRPKLVKSENTQ